jgi:hypothetical protein
MGIVIICTFDVSFKDVEDLFLLVIKTWTEISNNCLFY